MARTRSLKVASAKSEESRDTEASNTGPKFQLVSNAGECPKIFILPSAATPEARIVTLPHPRHSQPSRYLVCPENGIYEFTKIAAPKTTPRSWLLEAAKGSDTKTEVTMSSDLFVATPIDPLFLVLPALAEFRISKDSDQRKRLFLSSDDHFDKLPQEHSHMSAMLQWEATRSLIEDRMAAVCDTAEVGDESMFRLSEGKLLQVILDKAQRMSIDGLPSSMEEKLVKKALEAPLVLKKSEVAETKIGDSGAPTSQTDSVASRSTPSESDSEPSAASNGSTAATSLTSETGEVLVNAIEASPEVLSLQRLRVAFDFICSSYITPALASELRQSLENGEAASVDFSPLKNYQGSLEKLRSRAMVATSAADFSRRRHREEEDEDERQEKKRKLEEAKKKKASESKAVRDLKKVDTTGMKKLSAFFKKK